MKLGLKRNPQFFGVFPDPINANINFCLSCQLSCKIKCDDICIKIMAEVLPVYFKKPFIGNKNEIDVRNLFLFFFENGSDKLFKLFSVF